MLVHCLLALAEAEDAIFIAGSSTTAAELSAQLPASSDGGPQRVVGTLDLNQGEAFCASYTTMHALHFDIR